MRLAVAAILAALLSGCANFAGIRSDHRMASPH
jgi:hypothetical protein